MDEQIKVNKFMLGEYSEHEKENWASSKRIVVYENDEQLQNFVVQSLTDKTYNKKMYFGYILPELADRIRNATGVDTYRLNCSLSSSEIIKIVRDHGNQTIEQLRGQRAVLLSDFLNFPLVIGNPEKIILDKENRFGKPVIKFIKHINGKNTVVTVKSDKSNDIFIQTAYIGIKKGTLAAPTDEQASINTPEASGGTGSPVSSILPQAEKNVNSLSEKSSEPNEPKKETNRDRYMRAQQELRTGTRKSPSKPSGKPPSGSGNGSGK